MPNPLSNYATGRLIQEENQVPEIVLLTIRDNENNFTFNLAANTEDITHKGVVFSSYPFELVLGDSSPDSLPEVKIKIDNVHRELVKTLRTMKRPPSVDIIVILADRPDFDEITITDLVLRNVSYDVQSIQGVLYGENLHDTRYPKDVISPASGYDGLFK